MKEVEVWRDIGGYEGYYQVSNMGRIMSVPRIDRLGRSIGGKILSLGGGRERYANVWLCIDGTNTCFQVHKLVMEAFVGPYPPDMEVNHKNGIKRDNRLANLGYVTKSENSLHAHRVLMRGADNRGERHGMSVLLDDEVRSIRLLYGTGKYNYNMLAEFFGVDRMTVSRIAKGVGWTHIE